MAQLKILDFARLFLIIAAFVYVADAKARNPDSWPWLQSDMTDHLGAEYNEVAKAIVQGRGWSDPFRLQTGPTAWMPPVLPLLLAAVYWVTGSSTPEHAIELMLMIAWLAVFLSGLIVVHEARKSGKAWIGYLVFTVGIMANYHELFQKTHDSAFLLLLVNCLYLGLTSLRSSVTKRMIVLWGLFGGLCALCSPVIGAVWALLTSCRLWNAQWVSKLSASPSPPAPLPEAGRGEIEVKTVVRGKFVREHWIQSKQPLILAALVSMIVVSPWVIRNKMLLGKWVPIKSNGMYELWQSQCLDEDGVVDLTTFVDHPWLSDGPQRKQYAAMGETAFIAEKAALGIQAIRQAPLSFVERMLNRVAAATFYYVPFSEYDVRQGDGWPLFLKRLVFPIPLLSILVILAFRSVPIPVQISLAIGILCLSLLPYMMVSYYERYAMPLICMKMLIVVHALQLVLNSARTAVLRQRAVPR